MTKNFSLDPNLITQLQSELEKEKKRLEEELASFAVEDPKMSGDWDAKFPVTTASSSMSHSAQDEQADIREEYEVELAQEQALELRLQAVRQALERIKMGSYGLCRSCQQTIPEARLRANPAAEYDIEHQPRE